LPFLIFQASPGLFRLEDRFSQLPPEYFSCYTDYFTLPRIAGASPRRKQAKILWEEAEILRGSTIFCGGAQYFKGELQKHQEGVNILRESHKNIKRESIF
jgi:hypothetical protein